MAGAVFVAVVLLRFLIPLAIPRYALPAILACLVLDAADQTIFQAFTDDPLEGYQTYDKALDVYYLAVAYCSTMRNWRDPVAFAVSRFLYLFRLVGVVLFELAGARWLLLVFPNTFEYFFIAYEAVRTRWNPRRLGAVAVVGMAAFIWIVIKLPQEWWIHVAKLDFTEFMAERPALWWVLLGLVVVAGGTIYALRARIPTADWAFTMDVDRHLPALPARHRGASLRDPVLWEKTFMLVLISVIFAQVLEARIESSDLGVAIGVAVLVISNAFVSELWYRRGHSWTNELSAFATMLAINLGLVFLDSLLTRGGENRPRLVTVFFVVLLSMLITLFDWMRSTRGADDERADVWDAVREARRQRRLPLAPA